MKMITVMMQSLVPGEYDQWQLSEVTATTVVLPNCTIIGDFAAVKSGDYWTIIEVSTGCPCAQSEATKRRAIERAAVKITRNAHVWDQAIQIATDRKNELLKATAA